MIKLDVLEAFLRRECISNIELVSLEAKIGDGSLNESTKHAIKRKALI